MRLDLGCGPAPLEGFVGIDLPPSRAKHLPDIRLERGCEWWIENWLQPHVDERGIIRFDLARGMPWPFHDNSIDELYSSHLIEHLPASTVCAYDYAPEPAETTNTPDRQAFYVGKRDALLRFMDEAWRVTKPGGQFLLRWPALIDRRTKKFCATAFRDPTHYRFIDLNQALYWSRAGRKALNVEQYETVCNWKIVRTAQRIYGEDPETQEIENEMILEKEP